MKVFENYDTRYSWLDRLVDERDDLADKIDKLHAYLETAQSVEDNDEEARELLLEQEKVMKRYLDILQGRLEIGIEEFVSLEHSKKIRV